jgi:hypothetical protein
MSVCRFPLRPRWTEEDGACCSVDSPKCWAHWIDPEYVFHFKNCSVTRLTITVEINEYDHKILRPSADLGIGAKVTFSIDSGEFCSVIIFIFISLISCVFIRYISRYSSRKITTADRYRSAPNATPVGRGPLAVSTLS